MEQVLTPPFRLGIIAGGQLGKMLALAASNWDIKTVVMDRSDDMPAAGVCNTFIKGDYTDFTDVYNFGKQVDLLTFEIENVNIEALYKLQKEGVRIFPEPQVLELIRDKQLQKEFYVRHGLATAPFQTFNSREEIKNAITNGTLQFPFVQKLRTSGYDGKGVAVIKGPGDLGKLLDGPSIAEKKIEIAQEVAIQVTRNRAGQTSVFPLVDLEFNPEANLVELLACPSSATEAVQQQARQLALTIINELNMTGLLAVEFFVDAAGNLYVNEVSPRPHNSGHHTIESCVTSQYEQHLRSIMGFAPGSTELKLPSVMINLLGAQGYDGPAQYHGIPECMSIEGIKIHLYGKTHTKPFRKMGHATILDKSLDAAKQKAKKVRELFRITS